MNEEWDDSYGEGAGGNPLPPFLFDPLGVLKRRWVWMLAVVVLGLGVTAVVGHSWQELYRADASVLITRQEVPESFVRSTVREDSMANFNTTVGQVLSHENLSKIIDQYELYPGAQGKVPLISLVTRLRSEISVAPERSVFTGSRGQSSLIYRLSFTSDVPQQAADVTNALAGLLVEASLAQRNEQAQRVTRFLTRALAEDEKELREQSGLVSEFRRTHRGELPGELDTNLRKLEMSSQRRSELNVRIAEANSRIAELSSQPAAFAPSENQILLEELQRTYAREAAVHTDEHPNVVSLRRRIDRLQAIADSEAGGESSAAASEARHRDLLRSQLVALDAKLAEVSERIERTPAVDEQLGALEQKEQVLRENYLSSLRKVEEAELAETLESAQQGAQVSVLDRAQAPVAPVNPRGLAILGGAIFSVLLGIGIAVLLELLDPVVLSAGQIERIAERPVLGSLPRIA